MPGEDGSEGIQGPPGLKGMGGDGGGIGRTGERGIETEILSKKSYLPFFIHAFSVTASLALRVMGSKYIFLLHCISRTLLIWFGLVLSGNWDFDMLCTFSKVLQVCKGIQVTQVRWELLWRVLKALSGYQDCQAEREPQEMRCLSSQVTQAALVSLGLWARKGLADHMEVQGPLVSYDYQFK